jgi:uncharacterized protein
MSTELLLLTFSLFLVVAALYASVGHAGASGYLALMGLLSFAPDAIKPTSLMLNIVVAAIASYRFLKAGYFDGKLFLSFAITSIPLAFVGGAITLDPQYFKLGAGIFLCLSAVLLLLKTYIRPSTGPAQPMSIPLGLLIGAVVGLFSGLIGVGGGIFLSPILIMTHSASVKQASGIAALFILVNSVAGLLGKVSTLSKIDGHIAFWVVAVVIGGLLGSYMGTQKFNNKVVIGCLFLVLLSAGLKFILVDFAN